MAANQTTPAATAEEVKDAVVEKIQAITDAGVHVEKREPLR